MSTESNTVAYIVGGSSGIGLESAKGLLRKGISVCITGRSPEHLESAQRLLSQFGNVEVFRADLYKTEDVASLVNRINQEKRQIQYLVNAAGCFTPLPFLDHTGDDFDAYHNINKSLFTIT